MMATNESGSTKWPTPTATKKKDSTNSATRLGMDFWKFEHCEKIDDPRRIACNRLPVGSLNNQTHPRPRDTQIAR